ncbi:MAG: hypothetical protein ACEQSK_14390 [Sphingomonadaceae bacterium]
MAQPYMLQRRPQAGIALPVMLIMLAVMMVSSIYLLKSSTNTTLTTANLAYDTALSKEADLGVHTAFAWLASVTNKSSLNQNIPGNGYVATLNPAWTVTSPGFWTGSVSLPPNSAGSVVEYVIHRMCNFTGPYNAGVPLNSCMLSAAKKQVAAATAIGSSLASNAPVYQEQPQLHYVITARIFGPRGGNVVTQAVVMMGP